jgi:hypothetical protein
MRLRLKQVISLWFVLQIFLPFTAPLQTCDLRDLLGTREHRSTADSPESSSTPTTAETESEANSFVSPIEAAALHASTNLVAPDDRSLSRLLMSALALSPAPQVQHSVLRL